MTRPNVLLLMADQLRWDAVGAYRRSSRGPGDTIVQTPHLDRLAEEGVRFERAYATNPFCMPARASVLTGRWPHAHGVWDNRVNLPPETPTLATILAAHGYRTGIVGKGHLDTHLGWDDPQRAETWHGPYYGFAEAQEIVGHNSAAGHYGAWLRREHPEAVPLLRRDHALEPPIGGAWKSALPVELHSSTWVADRSIEFIHRAAARGSGGGEAGSTKPFFLWASFPDPHPPFCPPRPYCDLYDPADMPEPVRRRGELADKPAFFRNEADAWESGWRPYGPIPGADENRNPDHDRVRKAYYYGMTALVDHSIGRILAALDETGQRANTIVVYVSDHGEMLGDHWLDNKGPWHYDGSARVPLLLRYPAACPAGRVVSDLVSQADIAPTICDLAGGPSGERAIPYTSWPPRPPAHPGGECDGRTLPNVQGISLVPAMRGEGPARAGVLIEHELKFVPGLSFKTLRTADYRITCYAGRPYGELYDLRADPDEFVNRWDDQENRHIRADLTAALLDEVLRTESRWLTRSGPSQSDREGGLIKRNQ